MPSAVEPERPNWTVLVIGGGATVGKTMVAAAVASRYGISVLPVDTIWFALKAVTDPAFHPELHYFDPSDEELFKLTTEHLSERYMKSAQAISQAMDPVVEYYLWEQSPVRTRPTLGESAPARTSHRPAPKGS